jgi:hypothetical protein
MTELVVAIVGTGIGGTEMAAYSGSMARGLAFTTSEGRR